MAVITSDDGQVSATVTIVKQDSGNYTVSIKSLQGPIGSDNPGVPQIELDGRVVYS